MSISGLPKNELGINKIHTVDSQTQKGEQESMRCVQNRMKGKHEAAGEKKKTVNTIRDYKRRESKHDCNCVCSPM